MTASSSIPVADVIGAQTTANLSSNITTNTGSTTMYPSVAAIETYVTSRATPSATTSAEGKIQLAQDLAGTSALPRVVGLQGKPISANTPTTNQLLKYNGTNWVPANLSLETDEFTATAGQTSFTLTNAPMGRVAVFRNGIRLPKASISVTGTTVTYTSTSNNNQVIALNDRITIDYVY
jgi:hypothetical protein